MNKVTFFDVEYANSKNKAICQLGVMCEDFQTYEPYFPELNVYINPQDGFDNNCIAVHGITADRVKNEPAFPQVWRELEKYFTNTVIIGHNVASSDLNALTQNLRRYNIDIPEMYYICTYELAKKYVPKFAVQNYSLSALCDYFEIDIDSEHDAFDDACACADLFRAIIEAYDIDADALVKKYVPGDGHEHIAYIASPLLRKAISEFYGAVRGISIDRAITLEEVEYLEGWRTEYSKYRNEAEIDEILTVLDSVLEDGIVTAQEAFEIQKAVKIYLDTVSSSPVTLATQILDGMLKGIVFDGNVTEEECINLRQWLYDNIYLSDHFPFNKTIELIDKALEDSKISKEESDYITATIKELLDPVESLKEQVFDIKDKHVILSGNFAYGQKAAVEKYIVERGGIIDSSVKKTTDYLIIGDFECQAYSNGTYGTKVKKALEYNAKGCSIHIVKEADFFAEIK